MTLPIIRQRDLPDIQNVVVGGTASVQCIIGPRYHAIHIPFSGTTFDPTYITQVRLILNDKTQWAVPGSYLDVINQTDQLPAAATNGILTLEFERVGLNHPVQRIATAITTGTPCPQAPKGIRNMRIEFDIAGTAVAPAFGKPYADVSEVNKENAGLSRYLMRREVWHENVAVVGEYLNAHKYNQQATRPFVQRLMFDDANITNFRIKRDNVEIINRTAAANKQALARGKIRTPQAGWLVYDTGEKGFGDSFLHLGRVQDFQLYTTLSVADANMPVMAETLGYLEL